MALYSLNCYGEKDEIVKTYETERLRYGVLEEAIKASTELDGVPAEKKTLAGFGIVKPFILALFPGLKDADIRLADVNDMINLMYQVAGKAAPLAKESEAEPKN